MSQFNRDLTAFLAKNSTQLAGAKLDCPFCNREHQIPIDQITIGAHTIRQIPAISHKILNHPLQSAALVFDRHIETLIQSEVIQALENNGIRLQLIALGEPGAHLEPTVELGDQAASQVDRSVDLVIGAGSGVICDLSKWIADRACKPLILFGTAPSMNAHTSINATMTENGIKTSKLLAPARSVIFDVPILAQAPLTMLLAGLGDLSAREVCNADWKLSQLIRGTYFCPLPYLMTAPFSKVFQETACGIPSRDPQAIHHLSEAVLLSGLSMTVIAGETSPSSGAEHVISHYWDLLAELEGAPKNLHGLQVAIGTLVNLHLYNYVRNLDPGKLEPHAIARLRPTLAELEAENYQYYGQNAYLFNQAIRQKWIPDSEYVPYIQSILNRWDSLWEQIEPYLTPVDTITQAFQNAGLDSSLRLVRRTPEQARNAILHGNRYRNRYTILDLAWELGVLPDAAKAVLECSGIAVEVSW